MSTPTHRFFTRRPGTAIGSLFLVVGLALSGCSGSESSSSSESAEGGNFGKCEVTDSPTVHELKPITDGVLTVAVPLPSPGAYDGETPETVDGGYLYCLAAEIANRGGLSKIALKTTSFEALVTAKTQDFDLSLWDIIVTPEREEVVDFATPYMSVETGVAIKSGESIAEDDMADAKIGVLAGSRQEALVNDEIKPSQTPSTFQNNDDMFNALLAGQIDVALNDTTTVMPWATKSGGKIDVIAQYKTGSKVAPLLPKGSENTEIVSTIVDDMKSDGTLDDILGKWLNPLLGGDPNDLPVWTAG
ncbi:MAG: ABC transporter substrate-binding protein [Nocardioides sp.]|uniref:ABC transporter substrate-binding protein n=1 Tax=Nocardioides sp. TaxID=35761 RepID=UPI0039E49F02